MLARRKQQGRLIPLTPLVDVFLILLIFFMVTSSFLNIDMIPAFAQDEAPSAGGAPSETSSSVLVRINPDGRLIYRSQSYGAAQFVEVLAEQSADISQANIVVLPSARATMQALVSVVDSLTLAGAQSVQVVQLEADE